MSEGNKPFVEFSEVTIKNRRNLLFASALLFFLSGFAVKINSIKQAGIEVSITETQVHLALTLIVVYFLVTFVWHVFDEYKVWTFKLTSQDVQTSSKALEVVNDPSPIEDSPPRLIPIDTPTGKIIGSISTHITFVRQAQYEDDHDTVKRYLDRVDKQLKGPFKDDLERIDRFEKALKNYTLVKRMRYLCLEVGFPLLLSALAIAITYSERLGLFVQQTLNG